MLGVAGPLPAALLPGPCRQEQEPGMPLAGIAVGQACVGQSVSQAGQGTVYATGGHREAGMGRCATAALLHFGYM